MSKGHLEISLDVGMSTSALVGLCSFWFCLLKASVKAWPRERAYRLGLQVLAFLSPFPLCVSLGLRSDSPWEGCT